MPKVKQKLSEKEIKERLEELHRARAELTDIWQKTKMEDVPKVTRSDIANVVARMTGIPLEDLTEEEKEKLMNLEERIHERIVDQEHAVEVVSSAIRRSRAGLKDLKRPIGSFLFLGPTGVGKSELSKTLAEVLYGSEDLLVRMDMSEYMEKHTVSRLIGAPPGYVGFDQGGQLTEVVRRRPFSVILFDEIEKSHPEVFNILLQIMEDGRLTDGRGRVVDFKNTILIMTSNIGSDLIYKNTLGFQSGDEEPHDMPSYDELKKEVMDSLKKTFRPEFINRIDETVVFKSLDKESVEKIAEFELDKVVEMMEENGIDLEYTQKTVEYLVEKGYDPKYGARPIKRKIQKEIENPLSDRIIKGDFESGDLVGVGMRGSSLDFYKKKK